MTGLELVTMSQKDLEKLCVNFYKKWKFPIKIVRPFNNYGPGLNNDKRVIPDFSKNILNGQDIILYSDGNLADFLLYIRCSNWLYKNFNQRYTW